jgi:hypothetical protein
MLSWLASCDVTNGTSDPRCSKNEHSHASFWARDGFGCFQATFPDSFAELCIRQNSCNQLAKIHYFNDKILAVTPPNNTGALVS